MNIAVEISLYPLGEEIDPPIRQFLEHLQQFEKIDVNPGPMSTVISGDYDTVMSLLNASIRPVLDKHSATFVIKLSNACPV